MSDITAFTQPDQTARAVRFWDYAVGDVRITLRPGEERHWCRFHVDQEVGASVVCR